METYYGQVRTPNDAIILFEACRIGLLPRVQRRLSEKERQSIRSGSVFVWDEREAGMRRWTDGKSWSASRVAGSFLHYREMEGKRGGSSFPAPTSSPNSGMNDPRGMDSDMGGDGLADGYRYKPDGLVKQSFSIATSQGQHLHLISYYARSSNSSPALLQPSTDPQLRHIQLPKGLYPESTVADGQNVPAVTRSPMVGPYSGSPSQPHNGYNGRPSPAMSGYGPGPSYGWPPSPLNTPPAHYGQYSPFSSNAPPPHTPMSQSPSYYNQPAYPPHPQRAVSGPTAFDRAPPAMSNHLPPPPPQAPTSHPFQHSPSTSSQGPPANYSPYGTHNSSPHLPPIQNGTRLSPPFGQRPGSGELSRTNSYQNSPSDWSRKNDDRPQSGTIPSIGVLVNGVAEAESRSQYKNGHPPLMHSNSACGPMAFTAAQPPRRPSPPLTKKEHGSYDKSSSFGQDNNMLRQLDRAFSVK